MSGFKCNYHNEQKGVDFNDLYLDDAGVIASFKKNDVDDRKKEIIQTCNNRIRLFLAEYDFNTKLGIDWNGYFNSNQKNISRSLKSKLIQEISSVNGVVAVSSFKYKPDRVKRVLNIDIKIELFDSSTETINFNRYIG
ncbi:hypothetical protein [Francisella tularensis]|uniref:hypothetical protein n=1 Tax=Francisella tularensis TaxID=263 RepID=UPI0008F531D7|nr:hypothetical protein [Francisella tularensis]APA83239.1 hypothetical protein N894_1255 [Francisella tularensis subsp. novicida PA10-7858]